MQTEPKAAWIIDENTKIFAETHGAPTFLSPLPNRASPFQVGEGCCRLPEEKPTILAERRGEAVTARMDGFVVRSREETCLDPQWSRAPPGIEGACGHRDTALLRSIVHTTTLVVPKGPGMVADLVSLRVPRGISPYVQRRNQRF
jgi:hypothetical protein